MSRSVSSSPSDTGDATHALNAPWAFWYFMKVGKTWEPTEVLTVKTVEDFWCVFSNIHKPSKLKEGVQLYLFRERAVPMWEHSSNTGGGVFSFEYKRPHDKLVDEKWKHLLLMVIGESAPFSEYIVGVAANRKKTGLKLEVWVRDANNLDVHTALGEYLTAAMDFMEMVEFEDIGILLKSWSKGPKVYPTIFILKNGRRFLASEGASNNPNSSSTSKPASGSAESISAES